MPYSPLAPLWCWNVLGEDAVFFSQPAEGILPGFH